MSKNKSQKKKKAPQKNDGALIGNVGTFLIGISAFITVILQIIEKMS